MPRLLLLAAAAFIGYAVWRWLQIGSPKKRKNKMINSAIVLGLCVITVLVVSGKMHWLGIVLASAFAIFRSLLPMLINLLAPLLLRSKSNKPPPAGDDNNTNSNQTAMTLSEAYAVLGLHTNASKSDVVAAHRRLMAKLHPDKGGTDYLAATLNKAKNIIITSLS